MVKSMPRPDAALKNFFSDNEVFADVFNSFFFHNEKIVLPETLEPADTAYAASKRAGKGRKNYKIEKINKYRDNIRRASVGTLVILGLEDQNMVHYSMPVRKLLYDALGYGAELTALGDAQEPVEWTIDESLAKVKKGTKITPIITVVFYTGENKWDGPCSLHEMMEMDGRVEPFVPDYPLYVIDIGHDEELSFHSRALRELKEVLTSIYAGTAAANKTPVHASTLALAGVLTGSKKLYDAAAEWKGGQREVCRALDEMCENAIKETKEKYVAELKEMDAVIAEKNTAIAEKDTAIAEKDTAIAEKDTAIAEKDAEIDRLRKQLEVLKAAQHNHEPY